MKRERSSMHYSVKLKMPQETMAWATVHCKPDGWEAVTSWSLFRLRFAEKPAGINVARKATGRYPAQIINATGIRTVVKARRSRPARIRITAGRRRAILRSLILLDNFAG